MNAQNTSFYTALREARQKLGLTQGRLAAEAGCRQSAISMLESGKADSVSRPILEKIAARLGVPLPAAPAEALSASAPAPRRYCPAAQCPSNIPFALADRLLFFPRPAGHHDPRCACCGELLEDRCPGCGATVRGGACCPLCGEPYVADTVQPADSARWAAARREALGALQALSGGR